MGLSGYDEPAAHPEPGMIEKGNPMSRCFAYFSWPWIRYCGFLAALLILSLSPARAENLPVTLRSINAVAKVQPDLMSGMRAMGAQFGAPVFIRIFKEENLLELWVEVDKTYELFKTYYICGSSKEEGPKESSGDNKSPEGFYRVTPDRMNPNSQFHLSFDIGYPNDYDLAYGRTGSLIMVHGSCFSKGCFAMTDSKMEEIYAILHGAFRWGQDQVDVHIFPFRMTEENMERHKHSRWYPFWINLKEGYDFFERERRPPRVFLERRYAFEKEPHPAEGPDQTSMDLHGRATGTP
jgi:murein L,D-transpeptidase YafK